MAQRTVFSIAGGQYQTRTTDEDTEVLPGSHSIRNKKKKKIRYIQYSIAM
jgi:hypothetical protein